MNCYQAQVVLLQTAHSWANAGVLLGARMHRERGSFRNNYVHHTVEIICLYCGELRDVSENI